MALQRAPASREPHSFTTRFCDELSEAFAGYLLCFPYASRYSTVCNGCIVIPPMPTAIGRSAFLLALALIALISIYSMYREASPFLWQAATARERVALADRGILPFGISTYSQDIAMDDCRVTVLSAVARLGMKDWGRSEARTCLATSLAVLSASPTSGYAALVAAYSSAILGDDEGRARYSALSRELAPSEGWIASLRIRMIREGMAPAADLTGPGRNDIRILAATPNGRAYLAAWYVSAPETRPALLSAMETLPSAQQSGFLRDVRAMAR